MYDKTVANTITQTLPVNTVRPLLGSVPNRKSFILSPIAVGAGGIISISMRPDVVAGAGILNFLTGQTFPTAVDDGLIGSMVAEEWFVISLNGGEKIQVTEYLYVECPTYE